MKPVPKRFSESTEEYADKLAMAEVYMLRFMMFRETNEMPYPSVREIVEFAAKQAKAPVWLKNENHIVWRWAREIEKSYKDR